MEKVRVLMHSLIHDSHLSGKPIFLIIEIIKSLLTLSNTLCKSVFTQQSMGAFFFLKSLIRPCARSEQSLIYLPFRKALWFGDMSSVITACSLLLSSLDVTLYSTLQHDIGLKSAKLNELDTLGIRVRKVWFTSFSSFPEMKLLIASCYSFLPNPSSFDKRGIKTIRAWSFIWVHLKQGCFCLPFGEGSY